MLYFAPLQGYTDFIYRKVYHKNFSGIDAFFIPYLSLGKNKILKKQIREVKPENNTGIRVVPQILINSDQEAEELLEILKDCGYTEVNINMGCPYPMVTRTGRGSGLLPFPGKTREIMEKVFSDHSFSVSVKLRSGLVSEDEVIAMTETLNRFPVKEIIYHPRLASQLFQGNVNDDLFRKVAGVSQIPVCYNGNLFSKSDYERKKELFPGVQNWMLGRGILMNPLLPGEINGTAYTAGERNQKLELFHAQLLEEYSANLQGQGHLLMKMKLFWEYFSHSFPRQEKTWKIIRKCNRLDDYLTVTGKIFNRAETD